jgi:hypothetical protein
MTWTNQMRMEARFLYEKKNMSVDEIGTKLGKTAASVRMLLVKAGVYQKQTVDVDTLAVYKDSLAVVGESPF